MKRNKHEDTGRGVDGGFKTALDVTRETASPSVAAPAFAEAAADFRRLDKPKESRRGRVTRARLIESARALFVASGVNSVGLEQIARHAGVTRGAVYWHFANKIDLMQVMLRELGWRLRDLLDRATVTIVDGDPLQRLEAELLWLARGVEADPVLRDGLAVVHSRCIYVDELAALSSQVQRGVSLFRLRIERAYREAGSCGILREGIDPQHAADDTCSFLSSWLSTYLGEGSPCAANMSRHSAKRALAVHFALRRIPAAAPPAA